MRNRVFVYGSLMPGHLRWPVLEPHATVRLEAWVPGRLYDTGQGWPAAVFDEATTEAIVGWVVELQVDRTADVLAELDAIEGWTGRGSESLFERVAVRPRLAMAEGAAIPAAARLPEGIGTTPIEVWSYQVVRPDPAWRQIDRWTRAAER